MRKVMTDETEDMYQDVMVEATQSQEDLGNICKIHLDIDTILMLIFLAIMGIIYASCLFGNFIIGIIISTPLFLLFNFIMWWCVSD